MTSNLDLSWIVPIAKNAYEHREEIQSNWEKFNNWLSSRDISIAVTGLPGVGKTVLCDYLTGKAYKQFYNSPGKSEDVERTALSAKNLKIKLLTIPGQDSANKLFALDELFDEEDPVDGVIHVVANGYSTIRSAYSLRAFEDKNIQEYRQDELKKEIDDLDEICTRIRNSIRRSNKPKWMLIAVTKIDLFYDKLIDEVVLRYDQDVANSVFIQRIQRLSNQVGSDNFTFYSIPVCSSLDEFKLGKTILPSQFRENERNFYINQFIKTLTQVCRAS